MRSSTSTAPWRIAKRSTMSLRQRKSFGSALSTGPATSGTARSTKSASTATPSPPTGSRPATTRWRPPRSSRWTTSRPWVACSRSRSARTARRSPARRRRSRGALPTSAPAPRPPTSRSTMARRRTSRAVQPSARRPTTTRRTSPTRSWASRPPRRTTTPTRP